MGRTLILAGDIGGTKSYLGFFAADPADFTPLVERRYASREYPDLGSMLAAFIQETGQNPQRLVLGVPAPVNRLPIRPVNLPWVIDPGQVRATLGVEEILLLNDLQATAYGVLTLKPADLCILNPGTADPQGNIAVLAAGTGLGEGGLCWTGSRYVALPSEGGHVSFSPTSDIEVGLWRFMWDRYQEHVSWERVVSGSGLACIYDFLKASGRGEEPPWLRQEMASGDPAEVISRAALAGSPELAVKTLDLFVSLYGAETGNLALKLLATGGVYVAGGIAPKILDKLKAGSFMQAFLAKGRLRTALETMPVKVVLNDKTGLLGAAYCGVHSTTERR
ncbi:MAG: glucokinase [Candidatus Latescibacteria bacterium]|nr:glucokinase [Candidatus Latescibacterota bacterium]